jgi:hypothetical protein
VGLDVSVGVFVIVGFEDGIVDTLMGTHLKEYVDGDMV